jgi:hypothetical protein
MHPSECTAPNEIRTTAPVNVNHPYGLDCPILGLFGLTLVGLSHFSSLLTRLNIPQDNWLKLTSELGRLFHGPVGTLQELTRYCEHLEKRRRHFASCYQHLKAG